MKFSGVTLAMGGMMVAASAMVGATVVNALSADKPTAAPTASPTPTPVPTTTVTPNTATIKAALASSVKAYKAAVGEAGGTTVEMVTANGYTSTAKTSADGNASVITNAKTIPQIRLVKKQTYVQLGGTELTASQALRTRAGKPTATWTSSTKALTPTLNYWLTPLNLEQDVVGLTPGITLTDYVRQTDGSVIIVADLYPEKVKNAKIRSAFKLPSGKKPTKPGQYKSEFFVNPSGVLSGITVTTKGTPVQVRVTDFVQVTVAAPPPAETITPADIKKATTPAPTLSPSPTPSP